MVSGEQCLPPSCSIIIVYVGRGEAGRGSCQSTSPSLSWPSKGASVQLAKGSLSPALQGARLSTAGSQGEELSRPSVVPVAWRKVPGGSSGMGAWWPRGLATLQGARSLDLHRSLISKQRQLRLWQSGSWHAQAQSQSGQQRGQRGPQPASVGWGQQASRQWAGLGRGKSQASAQVQQQSWGLEAPCFLQGELQSVQQPWASRQCLISSTTPSSNK